jgi:2,3-bisphosphoglycerate-independent phosphoglycerate mutase
VHSHQAHVAALANIIAAAGVPVAIHAFLDGRDTSPKSAADFLQQCSDATEAHRDRISIATISGRYYAMDRDQRWDRVQKAYDAMMDAKAPRAASWQEALAASYNAQLTDEFVLPTALGDYAGMKDSDGLLMANFRADRAREILTALLNQPAKEFTPTHAVRRFAATLGMVEYSDALNPFMPAMFAPETLANNLGEIVSQAGLKQLRIAETEKYAHVTFFFNGGREEPFAGEERILIPSPKVATYDLQPEMSAPELTRQLVAAIASQAFDFIVVNYANTDMVGHSGDLTAAIKAVEAVDACLGQLHAAIVKTGSAMVITADHGNAECLHDADTGQAHTAHTLNQVPLLLVGERFKTLPKQLGTGVLADIAPTLCALLNLPKPAEMTGRNLLP